MANVAEGVIGRPRTGQAIGSGPVMAPWLIRGFADRRALRGSATPAHSASAERIRALAARFPVVRQLAGEESFVACARRFVLAQPRREPMQVDIGATFAGFVRTLGADACFAYIADIAELEHACGRALIAPDTPSQPADAFAGGLSEFGARRVTLHPSVALTRSRFPVVSVWEAVQRGASVPVVDCGAECALISASQGQVQVGKLPPGCFTFLTLMSQGAQIGRAAECAAAAVPGFDIAAGLALLGGSRIVTALR